MTSSVFSAYDNPTLKNTKIIDYDYTNKKSENKKTLNDNTLNPTTTYELLCEIDISNFLDINEDLKILNSDCENYLINSTFNEKLINKVKEFFNIDEDRIILSNYENKQNQMHDMINISKIIKLRLLSKFDNDTVIKEFFNN